MAAAATLDLVALRHDLHRHPELGFDVERTATVVADHLRALGLDPTTGVGGVGVVATIQRGTSARTIGLRSDMDALPIEERADHDHVSRIPGAFHGCGHDGHTTMLLGAAERLVSTTADFDGAVVLIFQPDEENGCGAAAMIDDGLFDRFPVDAVYGLHNRPGIPAGTFETCVGPMMASEDNFEITVRGEGGHASALHLLEDPLPAAAEIVLALQQIVARAIDPREPAVVSVTELDTDGARNIVPSTVRIRGDARAFSPTVQVAIEGRLREIVAGVCAAHSLDGAVSYTNSFVPLVNTEAEVEVASAAARRVAGAGAVDDSAARWMASEDFARMLQHCPGCYVTLGNGDAGACGRTLHSPRYDFNDDIIPRGVDYWVALVETALRAARG